jgi:acetoin utilization deacetylase AcuC-like enzyme
MKLFYHDHFVLPLPEGHRFPMEKYSRLRERLANDAQSTLIELLVPESATLDELCLVHERSYVERVFLGHMSEKEMRRIGFP